MKWDLAKKFWLLTKQEKEDAVREVYRDIAINIPTQGIWALS